MRGLAVLVQGQCVCSLDNSSSSELANGDMIGMPIGAIRAKGDNNIGFHAPYMSHDLHDRLGWLGLIQIAIDVIQEIDAADTKHTSRCQQLSLTYLAQGFQAWIIALVTKPAAFAPGRSH